MLQPRTLLAFDEQQQNVQKNTANHGQHTVRVRSCRKCYAFVVRRQPTTPHVQRVSEHVSHISLSFSVYRSLFLYCWVVETIKYELATSRTQTRLNMFSCHHSTRADATRGRCFRVHSLRFWGRYLNIISYIRTDKYEATEQGRCRRRVPWQPGLYVGYVKKWPRRTGETGRPPPLHTDRRTNTFPGPVSYT